MFHLPASVVCLSDRHHTVVMLKSLMTAGFKGNDLWFHCVIYMGLLSLCLLAEQYLQS